MTEQAGIDRYGRDVARQIANVSGAAFQVGTTAALGASIQSQVDQDSPLIEPAPYAFSIWAGIFSLSLAYAIYAAFPRNRGNDTLRRVGWLAATAFFCTGLWSFFVPAAHTLFALAVLFVAAVCLVAAYLRLARSWCEQAGSSIAWLVAPTLGMFAGWLTAANAVSLDSEAVRFGLVDGGGTGEAVLGSALLFLGGLVAACIVLAGRNGPATGYLAYGLTVLWALAAIVVKQYDVSFLTASAAVVAAAPVVLALLGTLRRSGEREGDRKGDRVRPRAV